MRRTVKVAIVGGGISGLSSAFFLKNLSLTEGPPLEITVLERSEKVGGVIRTEYRQSLVLENGPESFAPVGGPLHELIEGVGLAGEVMGSRDENGPVYVVLNGRLRALPQGLAFLAPVRLGSFLATAPLSWTGKMRVMLEPLIPRSSGELDLGHFFRRRLGAEFTQKIVEPLVGGIQGVSPDQLGCASSFPQFYRAEQESGSLWRGLRAVGATRRASSEGLPRSRFVTFRRGMERLILRLEAYLKEAGVHIETRCGELELRRAGGGWRLSSECYGGDFDFVVLTTPAHSSAELLHKQVPEAAFLLNTIPSTFSSIIYLAYSRACFPHPLNGFGFVVPASESIRIDACTWVSSKFESRCPPDRVLLRCVIHHSRRRGPTAANLRVTELAQACHEDLAKLFNLQQPPIFSHVYLAPRAFPVFRPGHAAVLERIHSTLSSHRGLMLAGSFCGGPAIPDCIRTGKSTAEELLASARKIATHTPERRLLCHFAQ